jgi:hypothetical protein
MVNPDAVATSADDIVVYAKAFRAVVLDHLLRPEQPARWYATWRELLSAVQCAIACDDGEAMALLPDLWRVVQQEYGWGRDPRWMLH